MTTWKVQMDVQNEVTSPLDSGHSGGLMSRKLV